MSYPTKTTKYRIVRKFEDTFTIQYRGWFGIWWTILRDTLFGDSFPRIFQTQEDAEKWLEEIIKEDKEKTIRANTKPIVVKETTV